MQKLPQLPFDTFERGNAPTAILQDLMVNFVKKIDVSNIDFYRHTNNVEYVKFMFSTLDFNFVDKCEFVDFEIDLI